MVRGLQRLPRWSRGSSQESVAWRCLSAGIAIAIRYAAFHKIRRHTIWLYEVKLRCIYIFFRYFSPQRKDFVCTNRFISLKTLRSGALGLSVRCCTVWRTGHRCVLNCTNGSHHSHAVPVVMRNVV